jgi:hypothetical protein
MEITKDGNKMHYLSQMPETWNPENDFMKKKKMVSLKSLKI